VAVDEPIKAEKKYFFDILKHSLTLIVPLECLYSLQQPKEWYDILSELGKKS